MKIFAIDTTVKVAAAALVEEGKLIAEYSLNTDTHSTTLLPMISSVLALSERKVSDIDLFAVSAGPGSFTGVRIGVSTIKGLAFADNIPCAGVSSLEAMAMNFTGIRGTIVPVINARNKMVYTALFESDGCHNPKRLSEDEQILISDLLEKLHSFPGPFYFTGDAYSLLLGENDKPEDTEVTPEKLRIPSGYGVAVAAEKIWNSTEDKSVFQEPRLAPIYLRKSQAEREREEKLSKNREFTNMENKKRLVFAADHAGYLLKNSLITFFEGQGYEITDVGTNSGESCDYPLFAEKACSLVVSGEADLAILCCGTGIGMSIAANKVKGIRAACCSDVFSAKYTRLHNDANALCLGARVVGEGLAEELAAVFVETGYEGVDGGKHARRVGLITEIENKQK